MLYIKHMLILFLLSFTFKEDVITVPKPVAYQLYYVTDSVQNSDTSFSNSVPILRFGWHSVYLRATTADSINLTISYALSPTDSSSFWNNATYHNIATLTNNNGDFYQLYPPLSKFIKFRIIGNTGNKQGGVGTIIRIFYYLWQY